MATVPTQMRLDAATGRGRRTSSCMRTSWPEASLFRIRQERPLAAPPEAGREADGLLAGPAAEYCADAAGLEGRPRRSI